MVTAAIRGPGCDPRIKEADKGGFSWFQENVFSEVKRYV